MSRPGSEFVLAIVRTNCACANGYKPRDEAFIQPSSNCNLSRYGVVVDRKLPILLWLSGQTIAKKSYTEDTFHAGFLIILLLIGQLFVVCI